MMILAFLFAAMIVSGFAIYWISKVFRALDAFAKLYDETM